MNDIETAVKQAHGWSINTPVLHWSKEQYKYCPICGSQSLWHDCQHIPRIRCASCGAEIQTGITCPLLYAYSEDTPF